MTQKLLQQAARDAREAGVVGPTRDELVEALRLSTVELDYWAGDEDTEQQRDAAKRVEANRALLARVK